MLSVKCKQYNLATHSAKYSQVRMDVQNSHITCKGSFAQMDERGGYR